jgi:hypothetical protein
MEAKKGFETFGGRGRVNESSSRYREDQKDVEDTGGRLATHGFRLSGVANILVWILILVLCLAAWAWLVLLISALFLHLRHVLF